MSGSLPPGQDSLEQILNDETRGLRAFLGVLERERQALLTGDVEHLVSIAEEKNRASSSLTSLALRRTAWLAANGYGRTREAIAAWLAALAPASPHRATWQALIGLAAKARANNEENGELIRAHLKHNQKALGVLLAASDQARLYDSCGQTLAGPGKRHLGSV